MKNTYRLFLLAFIILSFCLTPLKLFAAPSKIAHQGRLLNAQGQPITTTLAVSFAIFDIASGGLPVWSETQNITPDASGFYETYLGNSVALPPTLPEPSYLEIVIDSEFLSPRLEFGSVPFSLQAGDISCSGCVVSAEIGSGTIIDANVSASAGIAGTKINPNFGTQDVFTMGTVGIGTLSPQAALDVNGSIKVGADTGTCDSNKVGALRWNAVGSSRTSCASILATTQGLQVCNGSFWQTVSAINVSGLYTIEPVPGSPYSAYCDMTTDGGGWTLVLAYNHPGGQNNGLVIGIVPQNPSTGYSHMSTGQIQQLNFTEARFYCETSGHARKIHFKTSTPGVINYIRASGANDVSIWTSGFTLLANHTGNLPAATDSTNIQMGTENDLRLTLFPFYKAGLYHWAIFGFSSRWECDDFPGGSQNTTLHQVWVR